MTILRTKQVWKRAPRRTIAVKGHMERLTPEQEANVRAALRGLRARMGSLRAIARAFGLHEKSVERVYRGSRRVTAGWAVRVAEQVGESVDAVLGGEWPKAGHCPLCGHRDG